MAPRTTYANLTDGLQPFSLFDQSFADMGNLGIIPCTATGTNAVVLTQVASAFAPSVAPTRNYMLFSFVPANTSTGVVTVTTPGIGTLPLYRINGTTQATTGDLVAGVLTIVAYNSALNSSAGGFVKVGAAVTATTATPHNWVNAINADGTASISQPAFSDISGSVAASQLPNPSASTLGGVESFAAVSHNWINAISTSGVPSGSQPAFTDISGTVSAAQLASSNFNILAGTSAGGSLTSSASNILIGYRAGQNITSGTGENIVIGATAGQSITTGTQNTILGAEAGAAITSDTGHTLIGYQAGLSLNGAAQTWNTFVGHAAGSLATGSGGCVAVGRAAGHGFLNDVDCVAIGHAAHYYNNGGVSTQVTAVGNQAAGAPTDGTGTNWQATGLTYWGPINDTNVLYMGQGTGKSSAAARTNASAIGNLARLPLKDNTVVLGHGVSAVETAGGYWDGWTRVDITGTTGLTVTAAQLLTGVVVRAGVLSGGVNDTTDTAANLVINGPGQNCEVPCSIERSYGNNTTGGFSVTLVAGSGVAISGLGLAGVIAAGTLAKFRFVITNSTAGSEAVTVYRTG